MVIYPLKRPRTQTNIMSEVEVEAKIVEDLGLEPPTSTSSFPTTLGLLLLVIALFFIARKKLKRKKHFHSGLTRDAILPRMANLKQIIEVDPVTGSTFVRPSEDSTSSLQATLVDYTKYASPYTGTGHDYVAPAKLSQKGIAALPPKTLMEWFTRAVSRCGNKLALQSCDQQREWTWRQYEQDIKQVARALISLGFNARDCINICGFNCPEWLLLDLGAVFAGGMAAGVYTSNSSEQCIYQAKHSRAKVIAVESLAQLEKYLSQATTELTDCKLFIVWDETADLTAARARVAKSVQILFFSEFFKLGKDSSKEDELKQRISETKPGNICALIYTSGTTGKPKAVSITHDNCLWVSASTWAHLAGDDDLSNAEFGVRMVSFLPLSHVAALMLDVFAPLFCAAYLESSASLHCADSNALKGTLLNTLLRVRPSHVFMVPRIYEKLQARMVEKGQQAPFIQRKLSAWARSKGTEMSAIRQNKHIKPNSKFPRFWSIAQKLLLKARVNTGLDHCRCLLVGAAPINRSTLEFFASLNMPVLETYGQSENTGPATVTHMHGNGAYKIGGCGVLLAGTELKIEHVQGRDKSGEGELCFRGRHIMAGYLYDREKTDEAVDKEGWLHSGDIGRVDEDGNLFITGRIKEILIGKGGENVAPVPVEEYIKERCNRAVANFVMCGNDEKYFVALCTPKCVVDSQGGGFTNQLEVDAIGIDPECTTAEQASKSPLWRAYVQRAIDEYNTKGAVSHACRIQKFTILPRDFSTVTDELGPTLKLKRNVVYEKFKQEIASLYE